MSFAFRGNLFLPLAIWLSIATGPASAMPAPPWLQTFEQPDGSTFQGYLRGDEHGSWLETAAGDPIARADDGFLYYVSGYAGDEPLLSSRRADLSRSPALKPVAPLYPLPDDETPFDDGQIRAGALSPKVLFILVDYSDVPATFTNPKHWANKLLDADQPGANSVVDYYEEASQGLAQLAPAEETHNKNDNGVVGWLRLAGNHPDPGQYEDANAPGPESGTDVLDAIYEDAVAEADAFVDYAQFDVNGDLAVSADELAIVVVLSGYDYTTNAGAAASVWPRKVVGHPREHDGVTLMGEFAIIGEIQQEDGKDHSSTIGVIVHELGHLIFGLPDLYDLDSDSDGIGPYGLMSYGAHGWEPETDTHAGETPVLPDAWSLFKLGWSTAASSFLPVQLHSTGNPLANGSTEPRLGLAQCADEIEYFLVQYRTHAGYDRGLDGFIATYGFSPGVLIFHVDESVADNKDNARRLVDVEEANDVDLSEFMAQEGNFWVQGADDEFDAASSPSSAYNDGAPSDTSIVVGAQSSVLPFRTALTASPLEPEETVSVTIRCMVPQGPPPGLSVH